MARRMSVSMTIEQVRQRQKTVTRRHPDTWKALKPGDRLTLVEKGQGLKKGEKQVVLAEVEVIDVRVEPLIKLADPAYGTAEVAAEGFPGADPLGWATWWSENHEPAIRNALGVALCRRIEWRYLDGVS